MASTSATSGCTDSELATTSQGLVPSSSSPLSFFRSSFSCCLDWVSSLPPWRTSMESDSMASNSDITIGCIDSQDEAFQGMTPSASAMGRSSALIQKPCYHVFINHRGPDVKKTLATRIYDILENMKVKAFLDSKELELGDFLPTTLEATIRGATLHIAIFSETYAESAWCLEELSLMLKSGAKILPVFYRVDPRDLRYAVHGKGKFVAAFNKHEQKGRHKPEKLKDWKDALHKVSFYTGEIIEKVDDEMVLKNIVNIVLKEISNVPLEVAKHPVGLNELVKDFENTVKLVDGDYGVRIVGIWGMGGSGKTTLARKLYNKFFSSMEKSSFIFDIRDAKDVLYKKQIQLLKDFGVIETFDSVNQGKATIGRHLRAFKVLIVMDDVDRVDQLDALLPTTEKLGRGSLIIVTTREHQVLESWGISSVYKMRGMDEPYAEQLFCWHAFLKPYPLNGFEELVKKFIHTCNGLPLSLKVFGAQLYGKTSKPFWESMLHKVSRILPQDIKEILKISYDSLDHEEQEAFLDCACFFIGREYNVAIEVWEGSGWSGLYTWEKLLNKCLVELDINNYIRMHDHLRDLGREIAKEHSLSRLWSSQQIINYGKQKESVKGIRGIEIPLSEKEEQFSYREALIPYLAELKLLVINGDYFNQIMSEVSIEPLWLCWSNIRQRNLPKRLSLKSLRVLQISDNPYRRGEDHFEELWEADSEAPLQLRELVISECYKFQRLPNSIGCLTELKKIVIKDSNNIRSLPESFCRLQLLEHLELFSCTKLSSLPSRFGDLTNLRYLDLSFCRDLKNLPVSFRNLSLLQHLDLCACKELIVKPDDFQNITMLEYLSLNGCHQVEELPRDIINQVSLRGLYLGGLERLKEVPTEIGQLRRLQKLRIESDLLIGLPYSLGDLSSLIHLEILECPKLESLPTSFGNLLSLSDLEISRCPKLESLPNSLGGFSFLTRLTIDKCSKLESLPTSLGNLSSLTYLRIVGCPKLESLPTSLGNFSSLTYLRIVGCPKLESLPTSLGDLSSLTHLEILNFSELKSLPTSLGALSSLTHLEIQSCPKIRCLPFSVGRLTLLEELEIFECPIMKVDFDMASSSSTSSNLKGVYIGRTEVGRISISQDLESLNLFENDDLTDVVLPSFARLTSLRELGVLDCNRIEKIEGLKHCTGLENLCLQTSGEVLMGLVSLEQMQNLREVELRANKGSAIASCIQTIKKCPDEITICSRAVPEASSVLLDSSILSPDVFVAESLRLELNALSSESPFSEEMKSLLSNSSMNGNAIMLCFVVNSPNSSEVAIELHGYRRGSQVFVSEGRWAVILVFTRRCAWLAERADIRLKVICANSGSKLNDVELERSLCVWGDEKRLVEALVPLLQSIST